VTVAARASQFVYRRRRRTTPKRLVLVAEAGKTAEK